MIQIDKVLGAAIRTNAEDIVLTVGRPPMFRIDGALEPLKTDTLGSEDTMALMKSITPERFQQELQEMLQDLPPRAVRILKLRYGLVDGETYTLEEVGRKLGVTRERVRQIEAQALSRLRHPRRIRRLKDFLKN